MCGNRPPILSRETVINHPLFLEATDIYCYANYNGETGTLAIMEEAWKLGKSVWFPRVEGSEMNFYLVEQKEDLQPGAYGILEPGQVNTKPTDMTDF